MGCQDESWYEWSGKWNKSWYIMTMVDQCLWWLVVVGKSRMIKSMLSNHLTMVGTGLKESWSMARKGEFMANHSNVPRFAAPLQITDLPLGGAWVPLGGFYGGKMLGHQRSDSGKGSATRQVQLELPLNQWGIIGVHRGYGQIQTCFPSSWFVTPVSQKGCSTGFVHQPPYCIV